MYMNNFIQFKYTFYIIIKEIEFTN